ncbi:unnamed protein product [Cyclocybe aegerita]|uniref:DUF659 domain-containing protein n=1 Tax=Cyclocybe aegerita TaxID=1973307 RepID=A0A8S0W795_CYCAE|nr:unnamed protein product [Cyclocybe aegerita]
MPKVSAQQGWWAEHVRDHPDRHSGGPSTDNAKILGTSMKWKVYCKGCWDKHKSDLQVWRDNAQRAGLPIDVPEMDEGIDAYLWSLKAGKGAGDYGYRSSAASTVLNHLANCPWVGPEIRKLAREDSSCTLVEFRADRKHTRAGWTSHPDASLGQGPSSSSICTPSPIYPPEQSGLLLSRTDNFEMPPGTATLSPLIMAGLNMPGSAPESGQGSPTVSAASVNPDDSISAVFTRLAPLSRLTSRGRFTPSGYSSTSPGITGAGGHPKSQVWTRERQASFEKRIARLTVSANLPLSWVDNPEWIELCCDFIPGAHSPSRKVLTSRIIPNLVLEICQAAKIEVQGKNVTLQADGWTGENHRHLIAFMITTEKKVYTVRVHDASTERKTAENLKTLLDEVVKELEQEWQTSVIAVNTHGWLFLTVLPIKYRCYDLC